MQVSLQQKQNIIRFLHQRKLGKKSEPQMGFEPTNLRGGSWVRIPSGARISSRVSYFQIKTFYLSDANYATDDHTDAFSSLHTTSSPPTFKQFVGNGQKLVQTRDSWKIQKKGNNVPAGKRKRVLVRKTRLLATSLSILNYQCCNNIISVSDSSVHIVAEFPHCSINTEVLFTNSLLNSIRSELLAFSLLL